LHQGHVESIFLDELAKLGVSPDRPTLPTELVLSEDSAILQDPNSHSIKVSVGCRKRMPCSYPPLEVTLEHRDQGDSPRTEAVHAKFVIGADGECPAGVYFISHY
jgi:hypothetical protein